MEEDGAVAIHIDKNPWTDRREEYRWESGHFSHARFASSGPFS
jgi:hypothetical protein